MLLSFLFLVAAALLPPLCLMWGVHRMDRLEPEPKRLCWGLFFRGALGMVPILVLELIAERFAEGFAWYPLFYLFLSYFVIPGFIEEGVKYRILVRRVWDERAFDHRFDAVVYAVFVSLGFAAIENVLYVCTSGLSTAIVRALFSIPGHAMFGIVMGVCLARAKWLSLSGQHQAAQAALRRTWVLPAVLHGAYDFLLVGFGWVFYVYFIVLTVCVVQLLRRSAREDGPIL